MAFITLEDLFGSMELMIFPNIFARYKNDLVEDKMVTVNGKVSMHNNSTTLIANKFIFWKNEEVKEEKPEASTKKLYLKYDTTNETLYKNVLSVIESYQGNCEVRIKCSNSNKAFKITKKADLSSHMLNELIGLLKEENVVVVEDKN